jgi:hypothetical protein
LNIVTLNQTNLSDAKDTIFSQGNYYKMFYDNLTIITKLKVPQLLQNDGKIFVRGFVNNNPNFNFPIEEGQETERKDKKNSK